MAEILPWGLQRI